MRRSWLSLAHFSKDHYQYFLITMSSKRILISLSLLTAAIVAAPALLTAQAPAAAPAGQSAVPAPLVYALNLILSKSTAAPGDTIHGSVTLTNRGDAPSSDIYYNVMLVGQFVNGTPQALYDSVMNGPVSLDVGQQQTVQFSYTIPKGFSGTNLGIRVQAVLKSGIHMGWADAPLSVSGNATLLGAGNASVVIASQNFTPDSGPTVSAGGQASYTVTLTNSTGAAISVAPHVVVYRYGAGSTVVSDTTGASVTIPAKGSNTVAVALPAMNGTAGVYYGTLNFVDSSGAVRTQLMTFRYIIAGSIVTIQGVTSDKLSAAAGDTVVATVTYTGEPADIANHTRAPLGPVTLTVVALDQTGKEVGRATVTADASHSVQSQAVSIPLTAPASALHFDISASQGNAVLSHYVSNAITTAVPTAAPSAAGGTSSTALIVAVLAVLVLVVAAMLALMKKKNNPVPPPATGIGMALFLLVTAATLAFALPATLKAAHWYADSGNYSYENPNSWELLPVIFINSPYDNQVLSPGQQFYVNGVTSFQECDNTDYGQRQLAVQYNNQTTNYLVGTANPATATSSVYSIVNFVNDSFSVGPISAPSTAGNYTMYITYTIPSSYEGVSNSPSWEEVYVNTSVSGSPSGSGVFQTSGTAPCGDYAGGYSAISWYPVSGATEYRLYRDSGTSPIYDGTALSYVDQTPPNTAHTYYIVPVTNGAPGAQSGSVSITSSNYCALTLGGGGMGGAPNPAVVGQQVAWVVNVNGGSGSYTYSWSGTDGLSDTSGRSVYKTYTTTGTKSATVVVTDQVTGNTISFNASITVNSTNGYSSISCTSSPTTAVTGQPVTWTVTPLPANSNYTYHWVGTDGLSGTTSSVQKVYSTVGTKHAEVSVLLNGSPIGSSPACVANLKVITQPSFQEF